MFYKMGLLSRCGVRISSERYDLYLDAFVRQVAQEVYLAMVRAAKAVRTS